MSWILLLSLLGTVLSLFIPLLMGQFITDVGHGSLTLLLPLAICRDPSPRTMDTLRWNDDDL